MPMNFDGKAWEFKAGHLRQLDPPIEADGLERELAM